MPHHNKAIVVGPKDKHVDLDDYVVVNTTSRSTNWSRGLSPFFVGPCYLYGNRFARNLENCWQFSKVYEDFLTEDGDPTTEWWRWSEKGFLSERANRYPHGKGAKPKYTYWDGEHLSYVEARKKIYVPQYQAAVRGTEAFYELRKLHKKHHIALWDFDVANTDDDPIGNFTSVINDKNKKLGHGYVLQAMLLLTPHHDLSELY